MSTRCTVHVPNPKNPKLVDIYYHHSDGYPEGVGSCIMNLDFVDRSKVKMIEKELSRFFGRTDKLEFEHSVPLEEINKMFEIEKRIDNTDIDRHFDIEWRYRINKSGSVHFDSINTGETFILHSIKHLEEFANHIKKN